MDRLFLDANVLFAIAWRPETALRRLWELHDAELLSSDYAIEEARRNLETPAQQGRLTRLLRQVRLVEPAHFTLPPGIRLPEIGPGLVIFDPAGILRLATDPPRRTQLAASADYQANCRVWNLARLS